MFLTLLQSQGGPPPPVVVVDTSDVLTKRKKSRSNRLTKKQEEDIAAQLLLERRGKAEPIQEIKQSLDWKALILRQIYGAETVEQLDAIAIPSVPTDSPEIVAAILAEIEQAKAARRLELKIKMQEAAIQAAQIENQISTKIAEQQRSIEEIRALQKEIVAKHEIAVKTAEEAYKQASLEFEVAKQKAEEFTRKRNNRIKRIKALMWLAKLDI